MSIKIKTVDNSSLDTIVEIKELPEFLDKMEFLLREKGDFEQKKLGYEWIKFLEKVFYSDVLRGSGIPYNHEDKESVSYYGKDNPPYFGVGVEEIKFGGGSKFVEKNIETRLECRIDPENKNEMRIKAFFYHDFSPFKIIEDALLLSHSSVPQKRNMKVSELSSETREEYDISLRIGKDGYNKTRLFMAPVNRLEKVVEEAKDIYDRIGEDKINELQDMKGSCNQIIADSHFGNTINIFRENEYRTALLEAMGRGTKYIFMDH